MPDRDFVVGKKDIGAQTTCLKLGNDDRGHEELELVPKRYDNDAIRGVDQRDEDL